MVWSLALIVPYLTWMNTPRHEYSLATLSTQLSIRPMNLKVEEALVAFTRANNLFLNRIYPLFKIVFIYFICM